MRAIRFHAQSEFDAPVERLWAFHTSCDALDQLAPPLSGFEIVDRGDGVADGSVAVFSLGHGPLRRPWTALHFDVVIGRGFTDVALESPFRYWVHEHRFDALPRQRSRLTDTVSFLPPIWLPRPLARLAVATLFFWRHRVTGRWLRRNAGAAVGQTVDENATAIGGVR